MKIWIKYYLFDFLQQYHFNTYACSLQIVLSSDTAVIHAALFVTVALEKPPMHLPLGSDSTFPKVEVIIVAPHSLV